MDIAEFWSICSMNGLVLTDDQMALLSRYVTDLLYWNDQINLISRRDTAHVWQRHILHSLAPVLMNLLPESGKALDIGTGGGLPGIPIKVVRPKLDITLVDSIAKKVNTVSMLASHIAEHGLRAVRLRAEELKNDPEHDGPYDVILSRATAPLVDLMTWAAPVLKPEGIVIALKGGALTDEVEQAQQKHPSATIEILDIDLKGTEWFDDEQKRIVRVSDLGQSDGSAREAREETSVPADDGPSTIASSEDILEGSDASGEIGDVSDEIAVVGGETSSAVAEATDEEMKEATSDESDAAAREDGESSGGDDDTSSGTDEANERRDV